MKKDVRNSCDGNGCHVIILPVDGRIIPIYSELFSTRYDIQKILPIFSLSLEKTMEKKIQIQKKAA